MKSRVLATSSAAALSLILYGFCSSQAFAQDGDDQVEGDPQERIVVTGSRIVRRDFDANSPIVTVDPELFENSTSLTVEGVLNRLPQFTRDGRSEFRTTSVEPTPDQTPGTGQVNLRGLGANRNLVLIDGRRGQPTNASMAVDTNSISASAIQRVEIISGGASAVYGADAIAGVVNFILRDNYEGMEVSARYGITEQGDGQNTQISGLFGADFDGDRGNVMFGGDLSNRSSVIVADRDWWKEGCDDPFVITCTQFGGSAPNLTNYLGTQRPPGIPDRGNTVASGNQPAQWVVDSLFPLALPCDTNGSAAGGTPAPGVACPAGSVGRNQTFNINPDPNGQGTLFTGATIGTGSGPGGYKYTGPTRLEGYGDCPFRDELADGAVVEYACYQELAGPLDRYSFFGRGRYELNEYVELSMRGNYATTSTRSVLNPAAVNWIQPYGNQIWTGNQYSPSSFADPTAYNAATNADGALLGYNATTGAPIWRAAAPTNPAYMTGGRYGLSCPATGGCTESQVFPLPTELVTLLNSRPFPNEDLQLNSFMWWGPVRGSSTRTDIYQLEFGAEGDLGKIFTWAEGWNWDASISHGETHIQNHFTGFASLARFRALMSSPNWGRGFQATGNAALGGASAGTGVCTSGLPIIREFEPTEDCVKAYTADMNNSSYLEQNVIEANLTGGLFELPAGPLQFAVGAQYRENGFEFFTDPINDLSNFTDQPFGLFPKENSEGYISVKEVYGELLVPVVGGLPLVENLTLELGGRLSDNDPTGQVETYKALADWQITDWARLRGGWNRATRAPNLQELFSARQQSVAFGFGTALGDPCAENNTLSDVAANPAENQDGAAGAAHARAVCQALMTRDSTAGGLPSDSGVNTYYGRAPADQPGDGVGSGGISVVRGNPDVEPETADTYTLGLVLTSPFEQNPILSGFTGSVDWYQIEIEDLIAVVDTVQLFNDCLGLNANPGIELDRFSCRSIVRDPIDGDGLYIDRTYSNAGRAKLSGVDLQLNWRGEFEDVGLSMIPGGAGVNLVATFPIDVITQTSDTAPAIDAVGTQYVGSGIGGGSYEYSTLTTFNYFVGNLSASLRWQYSPSIESTFYATDPNTTTHGVIKGASLFDLNGSYRLNDIVTIRAGVDNLLDEPPPLAAGNPGNARFPLADYRTIGGFGSSGAGGGAYDALGRRYFAGVTITY